MDIDLNVDNLLKLPFIFITEYLNGWVILIFICILIYFIILRNYYFNREEFYDNVQERMKKSKKMKSNESDEYTEENEDFINVKTNKGKDNEEEYIEEYNEENNEKELLEGFESPSTTKYATISNNTPSNTPSNTTKNTKPTIIENILDNTINNISTTLFDNIKLNSKQIESCKYNYKQVINKYILDLQKLIVLQKNNEYLNSKKQFDTIIENGIDNIVKYLANNIKSPIVITRTSIKTDCLKTLSNTLEILIDKTNMNLINYMNSLAAMNSTTIDYKTMMKNIDTSRKDIDDYIDIERIIENNGSNIGNSKDTVNKVLNKSNILPIYEKNFDRINQLINSDFNNNETNLANKYGQAYTDFLNEKKKEELDINPLRLASKIESGIVNMLSNLGSSSNNSQSNKYKTRKNKKNDIIEQNNPIPEQNYKLINNTNLNNGANIYNDRGNLGNYLIDKKTQKQVLENFKNIEGFNNPSTTTPSTTTPSTTMSIKSDKNKNKKNNDFVSNLLSGNFVEYIMENINDKMTMLYGLYDNKYGSGQSNNDKDNKFNIEENMIPLGFLFFVLSMLFYFIDTTS